MNVIKNWEAKRSSAGITITGKNVAGEDVKIAGCAKIVAGSPHPTVVDKHGDRHQLA
ncbi:hypothetical protein [Sphingomonas sp. HMP6]|uniref:hypothetical protein n=1 Tax=Sphingomonas sp. HMP6 TaxID=1517551 RepID=UPI001596ABD6|nr:hypothetical protein [Sphingomonas sp. HMP6]BCA57697.1 hypothetical protein HMP06_0466 [Sphingomonas sp. HMP6]